VTRKLALVTGGHRRLGAAIAARLAREGWAVAIHGSHDADPVADLAAAFAETGAEWHGFVADFSDPNEAEMLVGAVAARFGRAPDLLVNSAAMFGQDDLATVRTGDLMAHYAVNCAAPALLTKAFAAAGGAERAIVNLLDQRIFHPHRDQFAYTLSKQALAGLTQASARILAPAIRVNAVAPGLTIVTDEYAAGQAERLAARMPLARLPHAGEIADAVLYLASAQAVTGQILCVDGGAHMVAFDRDFLHLDR